MSHSPELPFGTVKDFEGVPPFMAMAFMPWFLANAMMHQSLVFWSSVAQGTLGKQWPLGDSLENVGDAPLEEELVTEQPPKARKAKAN